MSEEEFTGKFIAAAYAKDQDQLAKLANKAVKTFGEDLASELADNCYNAILLVDEPLADWFDSWFRFCQNT